MYSVPESQFAFASPPKKLHAAKRNRKHFRVTVLPSHQRRVTSTVARTEATAILTCANHPELRWSQVRSTVPGLTEAGVLMFEGDEEGNLDDECACSVSDLTILDWRNR